MIFGNSRALFCESCVHTFSGDTLSLLSYTRREQNCWHQTIYTLGGETEMTQHVNNTRKLHVEPLERRDLLCGGSAAGISGFQSAAQSALFARSHALSSLTTASSSNSSGSSEDESSETHLFATLTNSSGTVVGTAAYESETNDTNTTQV